MLAASVSLHDVLSHIDESLGADGDRPACGCPEWVGSWSELDREVLLGAAPRNTEASCPEYSVSLGELAYLEDEPASGEVAREPSLIELSCRDVEVSVVDCAPSGPIFLLTTLLCAA